MKNQIKWTHIMDAQPEHDAYIIQVDEPYHDIQPMGKRKYYQTCSWEEFLNFNKQYEMPNPNFFWCYAKDFPFPKFSEAKE